MNVPFAPRNLFHEKGKLILSVSGIAASLALILLLMGFRAGLYATITTFVENLGANLIVSQSGVKGMLSSDSTLPMALHQTIIEETGAIEAGHILMADVIFTRGEIKTPVLLVGYDPATTFGSPWRLGAGRAVQTDDEIALDAWLAKRVGVDLGDTVSLLGSDFTVVGLTRETSSWMSPYIFISLDAAEQALGAVGTVSYHLLRLPEGTRPRLAARKLEAAVRGISAMTPAEIAESDRRVLATIMDSPINVMLLIGVVIGIAVMGLTAYTAVSDRIREYGVLKAVGASRPRLAWLVTVETIYRAGVGYGLGILLAYLAAALIMARWPQFNVLIEARLVIQAGGLAFVMSLAAALIPLRRLDQIDPVMVFKA